MAHVPQTRGRELARRGDRPVGDELQDAFSALGFAPRLERREPDRLR